MNILETDHPDSDATCCRNISLRLMDENHISNDRFDGLWISSKYYKVFKYGPSFLDLSATLLKYSVKFNVCF